MRFLGLPNSAILLFLIIILLDQNATSKLDFVRTRCMNTSGNYTATSAYKQNLNLIIPELTNKSSSSSPSMSGYSQTENPDNNAYALFYCRGDLDTETCSTCVRNASKRVVSDCPDQKDAVIWYQQCTLRYYANNSASFLNEDGKSVGEKSGDTVPDPNQFFVKLTLAMDPLINKAAFGSPLPDYATGEVNITRLQTLHCLVQCSPFITADRCDKCLEGALNEVISSHSNRTSVMLLTPSCQLRYDFLPFYNVSSTNVSAQSPGLSPASTPVYKIAPQTTKGTNNATYYAIRVGIPVVALGLVLASICLCLKRRLFAVIKSSDSQQGGYNIREGPGAARFSFRAMKKATGNFSDANKLGEGGFGVVYKGLLDNGEEVAIKRLSENSGQGNREFSNEVVFVAKLQHRNLVRLLGYCQESLLFYEFVPNLSLDQLLFDPNRSKNLDWRTRYNIILGIARGLQYLHHESRFNIVHRDLKTSNILLDADMNPKIADFGLAKLIELDHTQGDTTKIAGTMGYMAPEYIFVGQFSTKSDVYSFGAILLEIVSGRMIYKPNQPANYEGLIQLARRLWDEGEPKELIDPTLSYRTEEAIRCIQIGLLCVQNDAVSRPPMQMVLLYLNSNSVSITSPLSYDVPSFGVLYHGIIESSGSNTQASGIDCYPC